MADSLNETSISDDARLLEDAAPLDNNSRDNANERALNNDEVEEEEPSLDEENDEEEEPKKPKAKEGEEEEEEPSNDITRRPTVEALNKKFPKLLVEFPELKTIIAREAEMAEVFPTVDEAREAAENSTNFLNIQNDVINGKGENFIGALKDTSPTALGNFANNFMSTLQRMSPDVHFTAIAPTLESMARNFYNESKKYTGDEAENYKYAALYLSKWLFADEKVATGERSVSGQRQQANPREEELSKREQDFEASRYNEFASGARSSATERLVGMINSRDSEGKSRIDPEGVMSEFIRNTIAERTQQEVEKQLSADKAHMRFMTSLWERSKKEGYSRESQKRIVDAYMSRAKHLVPTVRAKLVSEALSTTSQRDKNKQNVVNKQRKEAGDGGKPPSRNSAITDPKRIDYRKSTDMDILSDSFTTK